MGAMTICIYDGNYRLTRSRLINSVLGDRTGHVERARHAFIAAVDEVPRLSKYNGEFGIYNPTAVIFYRRSNRSVGL